MPARDLWVGWRVGVTLPAIALLLGLNSAALAAATCIENPNREIEPGTHWYYRTDPITGQRCWYLKKLEVHASGTGARQPLAFPDKNKTPKVQLRSEEPPSTSRKPSADLPFDAAGREALFREFVQWRQRQLNTPQ